MSQTLAAIHELFFVPPLGHNDKKMVDDPIAHLRLTCHTWQWYVMEISHFDRDRCFGWVCNTDDPLSAEWGYFTLAEIQEVGATLDKGFNQTPLSQVKATVRASLN